jgi:hypothetical protein
MSQEWRKNLPAELDKLKELTEKLTKNKGQ